MEYVRKSFNFLNLLVSISVIVTLIWWHGFIYQPHKLNPHILYLNVCFGFYLLQFSIRGYISGDFSAYLRRYLGEFILFILLIIEWILTLTTDFSLIKLLSNSTDLENHDHLYMLILHVWLLIFVGIELGKATSRNTIWKLSPPILFILSFLVIIIVGSSLLMLPEMTVNKQGLSFQDALFTSISANCVTGLTVVDTATYFSMKGKVLIMILIQLGGLNIIAFATYFISFFRKSVEGTRNVSALKELLHTDHLDDTRKMVKMVIVTTLIIEFIGAIVLYNQWGDIEFSNGAEKMFFSIFHSVSAFNNAGFTLFTDGFTNPLLDQSFNIHLTIAILVILGGLGFTVLSDSYRSIKYRFRIKLELQSRIALISSLVLLFIGMTLFYSIESGNTLNYESVSGNLITSFFQSVTARTAGFNTVPFEEVSLAGLILIMALMFIGASSGSTGGGIKTSTFTVILFAIIKKRQRLSNYGSSFLTNVLVKKALYICLYSIGVISVSIFLLYLIEPDKRLIDLCFEEISAFGTVGLSTRITPDLTIAGKSVIMVSMFIGRIGPLALAYSLIRTVKPIDNKAESGLMLG